MTTVIGVLLAVLLSGHGLSTNDQIHAQAQERMDSMQTRMQLMQERMELMQERMESMQDHMESMQKRMELMQMQSELGEMQTRMELTKVQEENVVLADRLQNMSHYIIEPLAFSAMKTSSQTAAEGDVILFDKVLIDTHGLFNPNLGVLLIPETGIYEVSVNIYKHNTPTYNSNFADLYVTDTFFARIHTHFNSDYSAAAHSGITIIQEFTLGSTLYVRATSSGAFFGSPVFNGSQFSVKYIGKHP